MEMGMRIRSLTSTPMTKLSRKQQQAVSNTPLPRGRFLSPKKERKKKKPSASSFNYVRAIDTPANVKVVQLVIVCFL